MALPQLQAIPPRDPITQPPREGSAVVTTQSVGSPTPRRAASGWRFALACAILVLLGLGLGGLSYLGFPEVRSRVKTLFDSLESPPEPVGAGRASPAVGLDVGDTIELEQAITLYAKPAVGAEETARLRLALTRLRVARKQIDAEGKVWLQFSVCPSVAPPSPTGQPLTGVEGWLPADTAAIAEATKLPEARAGTCALPTASPAPANPPSPLSSPKP